MPHAVEILRAQRNPAATTRANPHCPTCAGTGVRITRVGSEPVAARCDCGAGHWTTEAPS